MSKTDMNFNVLSHRTVKRQVLELVECRQVEKLTVSIHQYGGFMETLHVNGLGGCTDAKNYIIG